MKVIISNTRGDKNAILLRLWPPGECCRGAPEPKVEKISRITDLTPFELLDDKRPLTLLVSMEQYILKATFTI